MGKTVDEFDKAVENLYGKSPEEVAKVLGKPEYLDLNSNNTYFKYEGVKDPITGLLSSQSTITFTDNKLNAEKPTHGFYH